MCGEISESDMKLLHAMTLVVLEIYHLGFWGSKCQIVGNSQSMLSSIPWCGEMSWE